MRTILISIFSIALLTTVGFAQESDSDKILKESKELTAKLKKVSGEPLMISGAVVKNKPYSAEAVSESIQTLADGNRIVRKTSTKMYRDSEGRTRKEGSGVPGNLNGSHVNTFPTFFALLGTSNTISIYDPVGKVRYRLNPETKKAHRYEIKHVFPSIAKFYTDKSKPIKIIESKDIKDLPPKEREEIEKKIAEMRKKFEKNSEKLKKIKEDYSNILVMGSVATLNHKNSKAESLGTKTFEGVEAVGTRTVKTIEAGAIGNELPIEITYEKWFSEDLGLIVYSRKYDPRSGEQIYRLTNIIQAEPESSLFNVPSDYEIVESKSSLFTK